MERRSTRLLLIIVPLILSACDSKPESRFTGEYEELNGSRYIAFARSLAVAINDGNAGVFSRAVDARALLTSAFGRHGLSTDDIEQIAAVAPYGLAIGDSLCSYVKGGGAYQAIMLHVVEERPAVLFRLIQNDGGLTYHDVIFGGTSETGPRIIDVFFYSTGEYVTESMGRMLASSGSTVASRIIERYGGGRRATISPVRVAIDSLRTFIAADRHAEALRYVATLPEEVRNDKLLQIQRYQIAGLVGDRELDAAVRDMRRLYPSDVSLNLLLFDYYFIRNELDSTLATIERLDKAVEGDPYLAYLRSSVYRIKEDTLNMRKWAERAIHGDRSLHYPYWMLLDLSLVRREHALTYKLLRWLERFAHYDIESLEIEDDPRYAGFLKTREYGEWKAWRVKWAEKKRQYDRMPEPSFPAAPKGEHDRGEELPVDELDALPQPKI